MQPQSPQIPEPAQPPVPSMPSQPASFADATSVNAAQSAPAALQNLPQIADDGDLIEKEWVAKIKQIITTTQQDPYQQSQQFSQLKADYMQKRYGKIIKSEE